MSEEVEQQSHPFRENEEDAIVSLVLDSPEFYGSIGHFMLPEYFSKDSARWIMAVVKDVYDKHGTYTRGLMRDAVHRKLKIDSDIEPITELLERPANPQEMPYIKDIIVKWAKQQAYGLIFREGARLWEAAKETEDYSALDKLWEQAQRITDIAYKGLWFFDSVEALFHRESTEHFSTGFKPLDIFINTDGNGCGPGRKEVTCWVGPTGRGKSIILINNGVQNLLDGRKVLHITLENSDKKTMLRYLGALTNIPIEKRMEHKERIQEIVNSIRRSTVGDLMVQEFPSNEISVNEVYALIRHLERAKGWHPDVIIIDYLELLLSRRESNNNESEYTRQKAVSYEMRGLATNENVTIFTATQTNRSGAMANSSGKEGSSGPIGLDKMAESFGKGFTLDYIISINQTDEQKELSPPEADLYIIKNRNGKDREKVTITINYATMKAVARSNTIDGIAI